MIDILHLITDRLISRLNATLAVEDETYHSGRDGQSGAKEQC